MFQKHSEKYLGRPQASLFCHWWLILQRTHFESQPCGHNRETSSIWPSVRCILYHLIVFFLWYTNRDYRRTPAISVEFKVLKGFLLFIVSKLETRTAFYFRIISYIFFSTVSYLFASSASAGQSVFLWIISYVKNKLCMDEGITESTRLTNVLPTTTCNSFVTLN